jgi:NDP-sugar pyrophosphorylase family protein
MTTPKPLVPIQGVPLIARILCAARQVGVEEVVCILNSESEAVARYCQEHEWGMPLTLVRKSTAHSLESFLTVQPYLENDPFLLFTTDVVFSPAVLPALLKRVAETPEADGVLGVTPFVDDEKPLWAQLAARGRITRLGDEAQLGGLVTAGIYYFTPIVYQEADAARQRRYNALRQFLGHLLDQGYRLYGHPIAKVIDVDRPADIATAEAFVAAEGIA